MTEPFSSIFAHAPALLPLALVAVTACAESRAEVAAGPRPISWSVAKKGDGTVARRLSGVVRARQRTSLAFEVPGRVAAVRVDDGDRFEAGEILVTLDPTTFSLAVQRARAELDAASATRKEAEDALERSTQLLERGAETKAAYLRAEARAARSRGQVRQAEAALETALERRRDAVLRAPFAGRVASRRIEPSETVRVGTAVLHVQGEQGFEVVASAPEGVVHRLELGSTHQVAFPGRSGSSAARLTQIAAEPDGRQAYPITLELEGEEMQLRSGMTAEVELSLPLPAKSTVSVPVEAFRASSSESKALVFVFDPDAEVVRAREVEVVEIMGDRVLIGAGLEGGEIVADRGVAFLRDGQAVTRIGVGPARFEGEVQR